MIRTINKIRERYERLKTNLDMIKSPEGRSRIQIEIDTLKEYLDNPNINLRGAISQSSGERYRTLRWIAGELV